MKVPVKRKSLQGGFVTALTTYIVMVIYKNCNLPSEFEEHLIAVIGFGLGAVFNSLRVFLKYKFNLNL